jgi:hypothetical protein
MGMRISAVAVFAWITAASMRAYAFAAAAAPIASARIERSARPASPLAPCPVLARETPERNVTNPGGRDGRSPISLGFFAERSLHTGEVVGSIPTAPTIDFKELAQMACERAHVSPKKSLEYDRRGRVKSGVIRMDKDRCAQSLAECGERWLRCRTVLFQAIVEPRSAAAGVIKIYHHSPTIRFSRASAVIGSL